MGSNDSRDINHESGKWKFFHEPEMPLQRGVRDLIIKPTKGLPLEGIMARAIAEVENVIKGTDLGIFDWNDWSEDPRKEGPKSDAPGANLYGDIRLYRFYREPGKGLVIQENHAQVHVCGPDKKHLKIIAYGNNLLADSSAHIWKVAEKLKEIEFSEDEC